VGFLDSFERSVERAVGGAFAKTFRSGVHPLEMVAAVKREMDSRAVIVSRTRILVPQHYFVSLGSEDFGRMSGLGPELIAELTDDVVDHLHQQGYQAPGTISISLDEDSTLSEGMVAVAARVPEDGIVWILVLEYDGRRYPIVRRHTLIGRGSDADISIRAKGVPGDTARLSGMAPGLRLWTWAPPTGPLSMECKLREPPCQTSAILISARRVLLCRWFRRHLRPTTSFSTHPRPPRRMQGE